MNTKKILYLHGFASSSSSGTVRLLRDITYSKRDTLGPVSVLAPDIPVDPKLALPFLKELVAKESPDIIIGTSMGGAYAQQLSGYNRICVNPGFELSKKHDILFVGKHKWMSARKDGEVEFHVTKEIVDAFAEMERHQFESNDAANKCCWAMFGVNDDTVDWRKMKEMFDAVYGSEMSSTFEGGHRMNDEVVKKFVLPLAEKILIEKQLEKSDDNCEEPEEELIGWIDEEFFEELVNSSLSDLELSNSNKPSEESCDLSPISLEQYLAENSSGEIDISAKIEDSHSDSYNCVQVVPGIYTIIEY